MTICLSVGGGDGEYFKCLKNGIFKWVVVRNTRRRIIWLESIRMTIGLYHGYWGRQY